MKLVLNTILLFLVISLCAQNNKEKKRILDLSFSFSGLGGDYVTNSMGIQLDAEVGISSNLGLQCGVRYIFDTPKHKNNGFFTINVDNLTGFLIDLELKKYTTSLLKDYLKGGYLGSKIVYLFTKTYRDNYQTIRHKTGLYGIIGWKHIASSGFLCEAYTGIGMQIIFSRSNNNPNKNYYIPIEFPWSKPYSEGIGCYPDITCNFRIGWRIKYKKDLLK